MAAISTIGLTAENEMLRATRSPGAGQQAPTPGPLTLGSPAARLRRLTPWLLAVLLRVPT